MKRTAVLALALALAAGTAGAARAQQAEGMRTVAVCTVENGEIRVVEKQYDAVRGDTTGSREFHFPPGYAAGEAWFIDNEPVTPGGRRYVKFGLPVVRRLGQVARTAEYRGLAVFAEPGSATQPPAIYIPVRPGCEFQRYEAELPLRGVRG